MTANMHTLPDARLIFTPAWLPRGEADALMAGLQETIAWERHRIRLFGREHDVPRLSCWIGDPGASYRYSGASFTPRPWPPLLANMRARLEAELDVPFNSVLANLYRDGRDCMGWHSDDEPELGPAPVIASLSLGGERRFVLKHRRDPAIRHVLVLPHGSLLVMAGATQRHYRHALPRTARAATPRINLTFRRIGVP